MAQYCQLTEDSTPVSSGKLLIQEADCQEMIRERRSFFIPLLMLMLTTSKRCHVAQCCQLTGDCLAMSNGNLLLQEADCQQTILERRIFFIPAMLFLFYRVTMITSGSVLPACPRLSGSAEQKIDIAGTGLSAGDTKEAKHFSHLSF